VPYIHLSVLTYLFLQAQVNDFKAELLRKEQLLSSASEKERRLTSECDKLQCDLRNEKKEVSSHLKKLQKELMILTFYLMLHCVGRGYDVHLCI
jgi:uncharacterized protein YlxW (UPF0749 family)